MFERSFFFEQKRVEVLFIGAMAEDNAFFLETTLLSISSHCASTPEQILDVMQTFDIELIFGTLSYQQTSYLEVLQAIRKSFPLVEVILFLQEEDIQHRDDIPNLDDILALKCSRYFCMRFEAPQALTHLNDALKLLNHKNIFLQNTQYFDALLASSVVSQSDVEGNITYVNENYTKVTGYSKEEVLGKNHRIMRHPSNPKEVYQHMWETIKRGDVWRERVLNRNKDGSDFWADTIIIPFKDSKSGEIIQYIAIRRDITQILEEKRALQAKEILANEQMKLSEAKDSFLILFTHELKTPLNAIINFSQYLYKNMYRIDEIPKEKRAHLLEQIYKSASSMLENVSNILDLSKLRNRKLNYTYSLFDVKKSLQEVIERHMGLVQERKCVVHFEDDGSDPFLTSDEHRFKQIIANILSNAIKYGQSKVIVSLATTSRAIVIEIDDDGKGIANKHSVFELYEQDAKGITSMEKKGTGIGLNFVKLLCEDLGFCYNIEDSVELGGTKFIVSKTKKES